MNKPNLQSDSSLYSLMLGAENELRKLHYSDSTIRHRWEVWKRYLKFSDKEDFQLQDWHDFLKQVYGIEELQGELTRNQRTAREAFQTLYQFYKEGCLQYWSLVRSDMETIPAPFCAITDQFLQHLEANGCVLSTITDYARTLRRLTKFLHQEQVESFRMLKPEYITPFIASVASYHGRSVAALLSELRQFFRFLYLNGYHEKDLSLFIPKSNILRSREHLPSIWSPEDLEKILGCVDIGNPIGKRDYAIILMVARLGLRVRDIIHMKYENMKWEKNCIELVQFKTKQPLTLPLFEDVGNAVIDYLKNGRPESPVPNIFIRHRVPYSAFNENNRLHHMLNTYIYKAGIVVTPEKSHGMHTLRHSLATELLKKEVPLPVISEILGHQRVETTANYLRVDTEQLRSCTLTMEVF